MLRDLRGAVVHVQKPVGNFIRAVLLIPLYVPLFAPKAAASATAGHVYTIVLKVQACPQGECMTGLEEDANTLQHAIYEPAAPSAPLPNMLQSLSRQTLFHALQRAGWPY